MCRLPSVHVARACRETLFVNHVFCLPYITRSALCRLAFPTRACSLALLLFYFVLFGVCDMRFCEWCVNHNINVKIRKLTQSFSLHEAERHVGRSSAPKCLKKGYPLGGILCSWVWEELGEEGEVSMLF